MSKIKDTDKKRVFNASRNIFFGTICLISVSFLGLLERSVFLNHLSSELLGLNSIFSSILSVLSVAEMGIGSALAYYLYSPLAIKDEVKVKILMKYLRKAYKIIGLIILLAGLAIIPFLSFLVKTNIPISAVRLFYIIYLSGTVCGYFFSFNTILLEADQKLYMQTLCESIFKIIQYTIQMLVVAKTENYLLYIIVLAVSNVLNFIMIHFITRKEYPFLKSYKDTPDLDEKTKKGLLRDIRGLLINRIGHVLSYNGDTFIISVLAGTLVLGNYSNYTLIFAGIGSVTNLIFSSISASIGNLCAIESKAKSFVWYRRLNNYYAILTGLIFSVTFTIFNPMLGMMYPKAGLFSALPVFLMVYVRYLTTLRSVTRSFEQAFGIFYQDRYKTLLEFGLNIIFSSILYNIIGLNGIFIGSVLSYTFSYCWIEPVTLFNSGFIGFPQAGYWVYFIKNNLVFILTSIVGHKFIASHYTGTIISIILIAIATIVVYFVILIIFMPKVTIQAIKTRKFK